VALVDGARTVDLPGGVHAAWSDASRGDLRPSGSGPGDAARLARLAGELAAATESRFTRVAWATQVHGAEVLEVDASLPADTPPIGPPPAGIPSFGAASSVSHLGEGDALVSAGPGVALCVLTADCGALALTSPEGVFAAVHAGWRGLASGVVEAAVERMRRLGATEVAGSLGPCIHTGCYEFSEPELDLVAAACGAGVRGRTSEGRPALDLTTGIVAAMATAGAVIVPGVDVCTACGDGYFSHRARHDSGRQALLVWPGPASGRS
jgi:copper oxidase (laccase) domain-containing protein